MKAARDPLGRRVRRDFVAEYAPLGTRFRFETNSPAILDACEAAFGRYGSPTSIPHSPRFSVRLLVDPGFTESPPWPAAVVRGQDGLLYVSVGRENTAVADLGRRRAMGFVAPSMAADTSVLRRTFLECLVFTMATHGAGATHTYVHASAVACGDMGLIFTGPPEAGKSTMAYALARSGFNIVTDDVLYIADGGGGLTAWGKPWRLRFLPDCVRFFPELNGAGLLSAQEQGVAEVELDTLLPGRAQTRCQPRGLFFLDRASSSTTCEVLDPEDAVELLMRDLICDTPQTMGRHRRNWARLAKQGAYKLHYGANLDAAVDLLRRFVHADYRVT